LAENPKIQSESKKRNISIALLFASTLAWFYILNSSLRTISGDIDPNMYYAGILILCIFLVASGIFGSLVSEKVGRRKFLITWICFGLITSISIAIFNGLIFFFVLSAMIGVSFGLGFPSCQAILTESVSIEKRGRTTGLIFGFTFILIAFALTFSGSLSIGLFGLVILLVLLKAIGLIAVVIDPCKREKGPITTWPSILKSRAFIFFGAAWMIFHFSNGITILGNFSVVFKSVQGIAEVMQALAVIVAAFLGGFLADRIGRKLPIFIGLMGLGINYALLSLISQEPIVYLTYMTVEGFALGIIFVIYLQVILGDISANSGSKERFYALGGLLIPFSFAAIFECLRQWYSISLPINSLTAALSVVILLSAVPVFLAPDTLPQQIIQDRKVKDHMKKLEKILKNQKEHTP
jgi:MFS family permease